MILLAALGGGCVMTSGGGGGDGPDADVDTDADTDADTDTWTGTGTGTDSGTDTGSESETDTGPPVCDGAMDPFDVGIATGHPYLDNENRNWTVEPPDPACSIELHITGLSMEACCDDLTIYDRPGGVVLDTFTGALGDFTAGPYAESSLYVVFTTDGSVTDYGFDIDSGGYIAE